MQPRLNTDIRVAVVGLGYVGLTMATVLAREGFQVHGIDTDAGQLAAIRAGRPRFHEPGLEEALTRHLEQNLFVGERLGAKAPDVAVLSVSTPVDVTTGQALLDNLDGALRNVGPRLSRETLVIVRCTVPVGTTRGLVLSRLEAVHGRGNVRLAFCPERTIQGQALRELQSLPQVIGAIDERSAALARDFFARFTRQVVVVSTPEAAELTKLVNNAHTDVLYAFANEVAAHAERHAIDPLEVIHAANVDYPRPDIAFPGFVGGGCLAKDPYLLVGPQRPDELSLVRDARRINEDLPRRVAERLKSALIATGRDPRTARLLFCGIAYKGVPATDDLRGNPAEPFLRALGERHSPVLAHDFMVPDSRLKALGFEPCSLAAGFEDADAVVFLNNHRGYRELGRILPALCSKASEPLLLFDCWRLFDRRREGASGIAIETGRVGPTSWQLGAADDTEFVDPRRIDGVLYHSIGLATCAHSSPAAPVS